MVHGNPTWSFYFRKLIKGLSSDYRAIAPDHIGCGLSEKPPLKKYAFRLKDRIEDLETFLDLLALQKKITLVVHDWGGMIGLAWAVNNPQKVKRLIITNTAAFLKPTAKRLPLSLWFVRNGGFLARFAVLGLNLFVYGALLSAPHKPLSTKAKTGLKAPYNTWSNRLATLKFVQDIPLKPGDPSYDIVGHVDKSLYRLKDLPMLICWGEHDFVFDGTYLQEWQRRFPNAECHVYPDAGHYLLEDEPGKVLRTIKDFLARHPG